ncbi:MAG: hypothetical protein ACFFCY_08100 [Promethearchaeota archaeon]
MDKKMFKKTYKLICDSCGEFTHSSTQYCEKCGSEAIRKATKEDYAAHERKEVVESKESRKHTEEVQKEDAKIKKETDRVEKEARKVEKEAAKVQKKSE